MKKRILLFSIFACVTSLSISSYTAGPATNGYDCTGAETGLGNPTGCSTGSGCHGSTAATPGITVSLEIDSSGVATTNYIPGHVYTVKIKGVNTTSNNLPAFGFQVSAITGSAAVVTPTNAGTFQSTGLPTGVRFRGPSTGNYVTNIVEHSTQLAPTSGTGGSGTIYSTSFTWTAPVAGTGTVSLWGALNAVDNDGNNDAGDKWNTTHIVLNEIANTAVANVGQEISLSVYPNPVSNVLNVQTGTNDAYTLNIFDLSGRVVATENITGNTAINTANWTAGMYYVAISANGASKVVAVVKQ